MHASLASLKTTYNAKNPLICFTWAENLECRKADRESSQVIFVATGNEEILYFVQSLNIKQILSPILPTSAWSCNLDSYSV